MNGGNWNRAARKSGGHRPAKIIMPKLTADDLEIMRQEALIRAEFGEEGVKRYRELLLKKAKEEGTQPGAPGEG